MPERRNAERNRLATFPATANARHNHGLLLKYSQLLRYEAIGRATGHDKSWVSRFLSGSALASLPELLVWLDQCGLRLENPEPLEGEFALTDQERVEQLQAAIHALERTRGELQAQLQAEHEFILALIELARVGLSTLLEKHLYPKTQGNEDGTIAPAAGE